MDRRLLPPLSSINGFESAARNLSHRAAAEELNLTHPAISHQIKNLEDHLGVKLFKRDGRNVILSDEGELFYPYVLEALKQLVKGVAEVKRAADSSQLKIQTYVTLSIRWLARRLPAFHAAYPNIDVQLATYAADWDFDDESADVGIIYCEATPSDKYHWLPLFDYCLYPVCSPELMGSTQTVSLEDLQQLPLIAVETEVDHWKKWFRSAGLAVESIDPHLSVDTKAVAIEMALDGEGMVLVNGPFVEDDLRLGRLVKPFQHQATLPGAWGMICRKEDSENPNIQHFSKWLLEVSSQA